MRMLVSQWFANIRYWLPLRDHTGKRPMSSVKSLLMGSSQMCSSLDDAEAVTGGGSGVVGLGLVE